MNDGHQADQDSDNHGYCKSRPYHREVHVNLAGARQTELIPFTDAHVPEVDVAARRVVVVLPPTDKADAE